MAVFPGFAGSGKLIVGRPLTRSPNMSMDRAPTTAVLPRQVTESVAFGLSPPQPRSAIGRSSKPSRQGHINVSIDLIAKLSRTLGWPIAWYLSGHEAAEASRGIGVAAGRR